MTEDNEDVIEDIRGIGEQVEENFAAETSYKQLDDDLTRVRIDLTANPNPKEVEKELREFLSEFDEIHYIPGQDGVVLARLD